MNAHFRQTEAPNADLFREVARRLPARKAEFEAVAKACESAVAAARAADAKHGSRNATVAANLAMFLGE